MTPERAAYIRGLRTESLKDFELRLLNQFANARRAFREARKELEEERENLRFITQVLHEREIGNVIEFPTTTEEAPVVKNRKHHSIP
jgi:hypothetical protein